MQLSSIAMRSIEGRGAYLLEIISYISESNLKDWN